MFYVYSSSAVIGGQLVHVAYCTLNRRIFLLFLPAARYLLFSAVSKSYFKVQSSLKVPTRGWMTWWMNWMNSWMNAWMN